MSFTIKNGVLTRYNDLDFEVAVPDGVTYVGDCSFWQCELLTEVQLPDSVTGIGNEAFAECHTLQRLKISNSITQIGNLAFANCGMLKQLEIPGSVTSIGDRAFLGCESLVLTVAPDNPCYHMSGNCLIETATKMLIWGGEGAVIPCDGTVSRIDDWAFAECQNLTAITIPSSVTSVGVGAFLGCKNIVVNVDKNNPAYHVVNNCLIETESKKLIWGCSKSVIPDDGSVATIGMWAFSSCNELVDIAIPCGVSVIEKGAFDACYNLANVVIPSSVAILGAKAFSDCANLTSVVIPANVSAIADGVFLGCSKLVCVTLPTGVGSIGNQAFDHCLKLERIDIPATVSSISDSAFDFCFRLKIFAPKDCYAEQYAMQKGIPFEAID